MRRRKDERRRRSSSSEVTVVNNDEAFMIKNHGRLYNGRDFSSRINMTMAEAKLIRIRLELDYIRLKMCNAALFVTIYRWLIVSKIQTWTRTP